MAQDCIQKVPVRETPEPLWAICSSAQSPTVNQFVLMFRWNLLCIDFCPFPCVLLLGITEQSLVLSSSQPPFRHWWSFLLCHLFSRLNRPSSLSLSFWEMFQSLNHLCCPPLDALQKLHLSLVLRSPELNKSTPNIALSGLSTGSLDLLSRVFLMHPRMPMAFLATRTHWWLMDSLCSRVPRSFSERYSCHAYRYSIDQKTKISTLNPETFQIQGISMRLSF